MSDSVVRTKRDISKRIATAFSEDELIKIDDWGFARRIRDRSEVIRTLVKRALDAEPKEMTAAR